MKKYIIFSFIAGLLFTACNPNKDIYDAIEKAKTPYHESFDIELSNADYTSIKKLALQTAQNAEDSATAQDIDIYKSFSVVRSAADYIPAFLADTYIALDSASSIKVKYHNSNNEYDSLVVKTMADADYTAIGGVVADSSAFTYNELPETYLPAYLAASDTTSGYLYYITCAYWKNDTTLIDTSIVYTFTDGAWQTQNTFYVLTDEDYESMGAPGQYHNFSDSNPPEHFLPVFLHNKFPYAFSKDLVNVFYKYYSGGTKIMTDAYVFDGSVWSNTTDKVSPFINNGTKWVFDPTVHYTMSTTEDYQIIVDYVANNPDISSYLDPVYGSNTEYYYGASSYYKNFYLKLYKRRLYDPLGLLEGLSDDEATDALLTRINEAIGIFLEGKYPEAIPVLNGVQVYYAITYDTYGENSVRNQYTVTYKCTGVGQFEYVSGPELVE